MKTYSQSFEIMPGTERIFMDIQYLKFFDQKYRWSLFTRSRATAAYDEQNTNLFSAGYLSYTTKPGIGATLLGRISTFGSGMDLGVHFLKSTKSFSIFTLPGIRLSDELAYSWFTILRITPALSEKWKLYSSVEWFSAFNRLGHASTIERIRLGLDKNGNQFGFAINLRQAGKSFTNVDTNPGVFYRKVFN